VRLALLLAPEDSRLGASSAEYKCHIRDSRNLFYEFDLSKTDLVLISEKPAKYAGQVTVIDGELPKQELSGVVNVICQSLPEVAWLEYRDDMDFPYVTKRYSRLSRMLPV
jgi:hypothetical protein